MSRIATPTSFKPIANVRPANRLTFAVLYPLTTQDAAGNVIDTISKPISLIKAKRLLQRDPKILDCCLIRGLAMHWGMIPLHR